MTDAPRRKNHPAGVPARILDAAFELFQAKSYSATSVQEISAAHHFVIRPSPLVHGESKPSRN